MKKLQKSKEKKNYVSNIVQITSLIIACFCILTLFFPALIGTLISEIATEVDPFELGAWAPYVILANLVVLGFAILYYKEVLPRVIKQSVK